MSDKVIKVSEIFWDTIQGEGIYAGAPAIFLRLQGCWLGCSFCDTTSIWKNGKDYCLQSLLTYFVQYKLIQKLKAGTHLVITGGSPIMQQKALIIWVTHLRKLCETPIFIEVENEVSIFVKKELISLVDCWNNSPKLTNANIKRKIRHNIPALKQMNSLKDSWFKFVISKETDWKEIEKDYLPYIDKEKIMLMPMGETEESLKRTSVLCQTLAREKGVLYTERLHIKKGMR